MEKKELFTIENIYKAAKDRLNRMRHGVDNKFVIPFRDTSITLRPLASAEEIQCSEIAVDKIMLKPEQHRLQTTQSSFLAKEMLKKASTSGPGKFDATLSDVLVDSLSSHELNFLFSEYLKNCEKYNPSLDNLADEELLEIVKEIKKKSKESPKDCLSILTELTFYQVCGVVVHLLMDQESQADK